MTFKSDKQRKGFFANLNNPTKAAASPGIVRIKPTPEKFKRLNIIKHQSKTKLLKKNNPTKARITVMQLNDIVKIKGTTAQGKIVKIRREFTKSGRKIPIFEIKVIKGIMKGKIVQAKKQQIKF